MNATEIKSTYYALILVALILFCAWLALSIVGLTDKVEARLAYFMPVWLVWTNLLFAPFIWVIAAGPSRISIRVRFLLLTFSFISLLVLEITFRRYLLPSLAVLLILLLEAYWLIPKWNAKKLKDV